MRIGLDAVAETTAHARARRTTRTRDAHYDVISAFIKSMRGSDPDAAVYWLARMVHGGEDPKFIARRILIFASEDVGNADPTALLVAHAAFKSAESVGWPECRINLAQAAVYMALAPKSNAVVPGDRRRAQGGPRRARAPGARTTCATGTAPAPRSMRRTATRTAIPRAGSTSSTSRTGSRTRRSTTPGPRGWEAERERVAAEARSGRPEGVHRGAVCYTRRRACGRPRRCAWGRSRCFASCSTLVLIVLVGAGVYAVVVLVGTLRSARR